MDTKTSTPVRVVVSNGCIRMVHQDNIVKEIQGKGRVVTKRASHVEWDNDGQCWYADMSPVDGPMLTGYETRDDALAAERAWLFEHGY